MALVLFRGVVVGLLAAIGLHVGVTVAHSNFHPVLPGRVYRCSQPSPEQLERFIRRHGIRTVVNLRGCCINVAWYRAQAAVCNRLDVSLEDLTFSASRLPSRRTMTQLVEVIDRSSYPLLFHCHQGADRTGLAAVLVRLLQTDDSLDEARNELHLSRGHLAIGRTRAIDDFYTLYANWLAERNLPHRPRRFRDWLANAYCPAGASVRWQLLHPQTCSTGPITQLRLTGSPRLLQVRCLNTSPETWYFRPGNNAGIHAYFLLFDDQHTVLASDRLGLLQATVAPGASLDLGIPLPNLAPGRYTLQVDLVDEQRAFFVQLGEDPLVVQLHVLDSSDRSRSE